MDFALTHAHTHDPDTSHEAARQAKGLTTRHHRIIRWTLMMWGPSTSNEIANYCKLNYLQVARRISDLKRDRKVVDTGVRRASPGGRKAAVWRLV